MKMYRKKAEAYAALQFKKDMPREKLLEFFSADVDFFIDRAGRLAIDIGDDESPLIRVKPDDWIMRTSQDRYKMHSAEVFPHIYEAVK